jgi:hypothetical protein
VVTLSYWRAICQLRAAAQATNTLVRDIVFDICGIDLWAGAWWLEQVGWRLGLGHVGWRLMA